MFTWEQSAIVGRLCIMLLGIKYVIGGQK